MTSSIATKSSRTLGGASVFLVAIVTIGLPLSPSPSSASLPYGLALASATAAASLPSSSSTASASAASSVGGATQCRYLYTTASAMVGNITSPGYPRYRGPVTCRYEFSSRPADGDSVIDWRVRLRFMDFELGYPFEDASNPFDCLEVDQVAVRFGDKASPLFAVYCGSRIPPTLMSSGSWAEVLFVSRSSMYYGRGFRIEYSFVPDFGITSGEQNLSNGCWFKFSSSRASSGTFTSPNYPGHYPRNIVCHYLFYGKLNQRVHIRFTDFNVEGVSPKCDESTQSDYVELSNDRADDHRDEPIAAASRQMTPFEVRPSTESSRLLAFRSSTSSRSVNGDRTKRGAEASGGGGGGRRRLCGDAPVVTAFRSESNFYHVAFYSNDIFDQRGFSAEYDFRSTIEPNSVWADEFRNVYHQNANSVAMPTPSTCLLHLILALTLITLSLLFN